MEILIEELKKATYRGKTALEILEILNAPSESRPRGQVDAAEILEATVYAEYSALTAAKKSMYWSLVSTAPLDLGGVNTRAFFADLFPPGTDTRSNLIALADIAQTLGQKLGIGRVRLGHVEKALAIIAGGK